MLIKYIVKVICIMLNEFEKIHFNKKIYSIDFELI